MTARNNCLKGAWPWTYLADAFWLSVPYFHAESFKFSLYNTPGDELFFMTVYADALYEAALVFSHLLQRYRPSLTLTANMTGIPKYTANNALEDAGRGLPALLVKFRDFVDRACNTGELGTLRRAAFEENVEETGTQLVIGFKTVDRFLTYYVQQWLTGQTLEDSLNPDTEWLQKAVQEWLKASEAYGLGNTCAEDRDDESSDTLGLNRQSTQHEHFAPMMQEISIHLEWGYILFQEMVRTAQAYMAVAAALKTDTPSGSGNRKRA